jgi:ketosteroid isomerase-like protein
MGVSYGILRVVSQENVELVRSGFESFNRRDFDAALAVADDAITWAPLLSAETSLLRGKDAIRSHWLSQVEALDVYVEPQELIPVGDSAVVVIATWRGRGRSSGAPVEQTRALVCYITGGRLIRVEPHGSRAAALEAARTQE